METGGKVANLLLKTALGAGCRRKYPKNSIETTRKKERRRVRRSGDTESFAPRRGELCHCPNEPSSFSGSVCLLLRRGTSGN